MLKDEPITNLNIQMNSDENTKLEKAIKREKKLKEKRQERDKKMKKNNHDYKIFQKTIKKRHEEINNLKWELTNGIPRPPAYPGIVFFNNEDNIKPPLDFNMNLQQHDKEIEAKKNLQAKNELCKNLLEPLKTRQYQLQKMREEITILKTERKLYYEQIKTLEADKEQNKTRVWDEDDSEESVEEFPELEQVRSQLDEHLNKIDKLKNDIFVCVEEIKNLKLQLKKLLMQFTIEDEQDVTKLFDWKPTPVFKNQSEEILKLLGKKANDLVGHWTTKNEEYTNKQKKLHDEYMSSEGSESEDSETYENTDRS